MKGDCDPRRGPSPVERSPSHISRTVDKEWDEMGLVHTKTYINGTSYDSVRKCNHRGSWSGRGHGTEQNLETHRSVAEVENEVGGTIY